MLIVLLRLLLSVLFALGAPGLFFYHWLAHGDHVTGLGSAFALLVLSAMVRPSADEVDATMAALDS